MRKRLGAREFHAKHLALGTSPAPTESAIGIRVKRWVSLHGIALNVDCDLSHFAGIVPCGIAQARYGITSLLDLGLTATMAEVDAVLQREFELLFGPTAPPTAPPP